MHWLTRIVQRAHANMLEHQGLIGFRVDRPSASVHEKRRRRVHRHEGATFAVDRS